jgi:exosortase
MTAKNRNAVIAAFIVLLLGFAAVYREVVTALVHDWYVDDNYSHGFLIVPLALYFTWERRRSFLDATRSASLPGAILVAGSLAALIAGVLGSELFVTRLSLLGTIAGAIWFLMGWQPLKVLLFPILFLLLMIPIPAIVFNQVAFPLQLLASKFGELALMLFQVPVLREGNVINLANTSLEVAEACSGIRSLISLLTLGIVYGYFTDNRMWYRIAMAAATVPVAIAANAFRVAGTGIAAYFYGESAARGFFHSFSGWLVFLAAFTMLFVIHRVLAAIAPAGRTETKASAAVVG